MTFTTYAIQRKRSESCVSLNFTSWNRIGEWLRRVEAIRDAQDHTRSELIS